MQARDSIQEFPSGDRIFHPAPVVFRRRGEPQGTFLCLFHACKKKHTHGSFFCFKHLKEIQSWTFSTLSG